MAVDNSGRSGVNYHYGAFPPMELDYERIVTPLAEAAAAIARYEQMLKGIHNTNLFLTPLARQEALSSSRMEGTISTLDELLMYEANLDEDKSSPAGRHDTHEVHAYRTTMNQVKRVMEKGTSLSPKLLRTAHKTLLQFTRGQNKAPGDFKTEQNFLVNMATGRVLFTPISPAHLPQGLERLFSFIKDSKEHPLIKTAIAHVEFESLHPFNDGNGRIGRILITLMLWELRLISHPHFYISGHLEKHKDEYIKRLRAVSADGNWTAWCIFFLEAVYGQAETNLTKSEEIRILYEEMKSTFRDLLASRWATTVLDFVFTEPVFRNNRFIVRSGIPKQTASHFTRTLVSAGLLSTVQAPSGRRPGMYAFEPLLRLVRM